MGHGTLKQTEVVKRIGCLKVAATEVHVTVAMELVRAGLGHGLDNQAACLAILCVVIVAENLKLLDLIHCGTQSVSARNQLIRDVGSVDQIQVGTIVD